MIKLSRGSDNMDNFVPDIYAKSIYTIDYNKLKKKGIKCLLFDLNNTIASMNTDYPSDKLRELFYELGHDFKLIIISNSGKDRVRPFKEKLNVDSAYHSFKPLKRKYKKIMNMYNFKDIEIACIGDLLITDIYGGNKMGFTTILVNSISLEEPFHNKLLRKIDNRLYKKLAKKEILFKGKYYE